MHQPGFLWPLWRMLCFPSTVKNCIVLGWWGAYPCAEEQILGAVSAQSTPRAGPGALSAGQWLSLHLSPAIPSLSACGISSPAATLPFQNWFIARPPQHRISFVPSWPWVTSWRASAGPDGGSREQRVLHARSGENAPTEGTDFICFMSPRQKHPSSFSRWDKWLWTSTQRGPLTLVDFVSELSPVQRRGCDEAVKCLMLAEQCCSNLKSLFRQKYPCTWSSAMLLLPKPV